MPAGFIGFFLRFLREDGRRRRRRQHGAGGRRRHYRNVQHLRQLGFRRGNFRRNDGHRFRRSDFRQTRRFGGRRHGLDIRRGGGDGAGQSGTQAEPPAPLVMPEARPLPAWILARSASPNLFADEDMEPSDQDMEEAEPVMPRAPSPPGSPDLPSPTPAHELVNAGTAQARAGLEPRLPAPATTLGDVFGNGAGSSAAAAAAPAPPPRRRIRFVVSRSVMEANRVGRLPGESSSARPSLSNGHSNGVANGTHLPGGSSSEEEDGAPGPSGARR